MPPQSTFEAKKQKILQDLSRPDSEYTDLSPIGAVDSQIRKLVGVINATEGCVTTSSCAGRVSVFLEGEKKARPSKDIEAGEEMTENGVSTSSGQGKGGGRWLFVSHDPVSLDDKEDDGTVMEMLGLPREREEQFPLSSITTRFVHLKFEPMILHIATASLAHAHKCHSSAMAAGFRESGIVGVAATSSPEITPHVAVRTQGLALDSIIGFLGDPTPSHPQGRINIMVSENYLRTILRVANERFKANEDRKERFRKHFAESVSASQSEKKKGDQGEWESIEARRARKRAEGLRRKCELESNKGEKVAISEPNYDD